MNILQKTLKIAAANHKSLCPRLVLGVRIGLAGAKELGIAIPQKNKDILAIVETDGCFVSGVEASTACSLSHRTMRVQDIGKVAATFVIINTGEAIRVSPRQKVRERALLYAPEEKRRYFAMRIGYERMPVDELLNFQEVSLKTPIESLISHAGLRTECMQCGEEIINEREIIQEDIILCRSCSGFSYYEFNDKQGYLADQLSSPVLKVE